MKVESPVTQAADGKYIRDKKDPSELLISKEDQEFLGRASKFLGAKWNEIESVVNSRSFFSTLSFAVRNFGFFWQNRKAFSSFTSAKLSELRSHTKLSSLRDGVLDNICGANGENMGKISAIVTKVGSFLQSWFVPKSFYNSISEPYRKLSESPSFGQVVATLKPRLLGNILNSMARSGACGKAFTQDIGVLGHEKINVFFEKSLISSSYPLDMEKKGKLLSALTAYSKATSPAVKEFLAEFIRVGMIDGSRFDALVEAFKELPAAAIAYDVDSLSARQQASQVSLYQLIKDLAIIGDDIKQPLSELIRDKGGKDNLTKVLTDTLRPTLTHDTIVDGKRVYISGMTDEQGERVLRAFTSLFIEGVTTPGIQTSKLLDFTLTVIQGKEVAPQLVDDVLDTLNKISQNDENHGTGVLVETIDALMPLIAASPLVGRMVSNMLPDGQISSLMSNLQPIVSAIFSTGKLNDPDIKNVIRGVFRSSEDRAQPMSAREMIKSLQSFAKSHPNEGRAIVSAVDDFTKDPFVKEMIEKAGGLVISRAINRTLRKRGASGDVTPRMGDGLNIESRSDSLSSEGSAYSFASTELLEEEEDRGLTPQLESSLDESLSEQEVEEISKLVAESAQPFISKATRISGALGAFGEASKQLKDLQEVLMDKTVVSREEKAKKSQLEANYKLELKEFVHLIFAEENLQGLTSLSMSAALQEKIARAGAIWVTNDADRGAYLQSKLSLGVTEISEILAKAMPIMLHITRQAPIVRDDILTLVDKIIDLDVKQPSKELLVSLKEVSSLMVSIVQKCGSDAAVKTQVEELFTSLKSPIALMINMQLKSIDAEGLVDGTTLVELMSKDFSLETLAHFNKITDGLSNLMSGRSVADGDERSGGVRQLLKSFINDVFSYKDVTRSLINIIDPALLAGLVTHQLVFDADPKKATAKLKKLEELGLSPESLLNIVSELTDVLVTISSKSTSLEVSQDSVLELVNMMIDLKLDQPLDKLFSSLGELKSKLAEVMSEYSSDVEISAKLKAVFESTKDAAARLLDHQLKEVFGVRSPIKGADLMSALSTLSPEMIGSVNLLMKNMTDFSRLNKMLPDLKATMNASEFAGKVTRRNKLLQEIVDRVFEFRGVSEALLTGIDQANLSQYLVDQMTLKRVKPELDLDTVEKIIRENLAEKSTSSQAIDTLVSQVREAIFSSNGETFDEYIKENFKHKRGAAKSIDQVIQVIKEQVDLSVTVELPYDKVKIARLKQFGLSRDSLPTLMRGLVSIVLDLSEETLGSGAEAEMKEIIQSLLKYDPKESTIKKLSKIFDMLKEIADKKPELKEIIDKRIMEFVVENRELIKPIFGKLMDKYFKSYSLELFKAGVSLDRLFEVAKDNFKIDKLQNIFSLMNNGGIKNYASLAIVATSSGVMGLLAGGARSYLGSWWSTSPSRIATDLVQKVGDLPALAGGAVQDINWSMLVDSRANQTAREFNKRLEIAYFGGLTLGSAAAPLRFTKQRVVDTAFDSSVLNINASHSEMVDCSFARAKISGNISGGKLIGCDFSEASLDGLKVHNVTLENVDLTDIESIKHVDFKSCTFKNCKLSRKVLEKISALSGCVFENCSFKGDCKEFKDLIDSKAKAVLTVKRLVKRGPSLTGKKDRVVTRS